MNLFDVEPQFCPISYEDFLKDVSSIALAVEEADWTPDLIVGVGRGGLVPATYLSHRLQTRLLSVDHSSQVPDFADNLLVKLSNMLAAGRNILLVDDINDSGATIAYLRSRLAGSGARDSRLRFAVMIDNVRSIGRVDFRSRTIDRFVDKRWFIFPWEAVAPQTVLANEAREVPSRLA